MNHRPTHLGDVIASVLMRAWTALVNSPWILAMDFANTYRPEAHYMRGPGPKWRAKHLRSNRI